MFLIDFILHIDTHIYAMANTVGNWTYLLLLLVIFVETGAVDVYYKSRQNFVCYNLF
ncbi:DedA protein [Streptococcus agalactiae]|uniref:DedA protein n=1 Tax=Streptococcus agalactiae TaxID=1311 RepID=A0A7Z7K8A7_STRAG|nr:DedA protein [Streptococcus agalactiae]SUN23301.1 DedA protein [Streptococcus agalactiae]